VRRRPSLVGLEEFDASFCIARSRSEIWSASGFPDLMQQTADVVPKWWLHDFLAYAKAMIVATFVVMSRNCLLQLLIRNLDANATVFKCCGVVIRDGS